MVCSHVRAPAIELAVQSLEGPSTGAEQLVLKVADAATARGLVHRHVLMLQQNARQVTASLFKFIFTKLVRLSIPLRASVLLLAGIISSRVLS